MNNRPLLALFFFLGLLSSGCATNYGIANYDTKATTFLKPIVTDEKKIDAFYVSGSVSRSEIGEERLGSNYIQIDRSDESALSLLGKAHWVCSSKKAFYGVGAFIYQGKYSATTTFIGGGGNIEGGTMKYHGGGLSWEAGLNFPTFEHIMFRIGTKGTFQFEDGDYYSFRKQFEQIEYPHYGFLVQVHNVHPNKSYYNQGLYAECEYFQKEWRVGASFLLGNDLFTHDDETNDWVLGNKIHVGYKRLDLSVFSNASLITRMSSIGGGITFQLFGAR